MPEALDCTKIQISEPFGAAFRTVQRYSNLGTCQDLIAWHHFPESAKDNLFPAPAFLML